MRKQKGVTLIETVMAIFLTVLIVVFLFESFPVLAKSMHILENHTLAASLGNSLLNDTRLAGFDNAISHSGKKQVTGARDGKVFSETFDYTISVQNVDSNKKMVWVDVTWNESGKPKKVTVETILVKN